MNHSDIEYLNDYLSSAYEETLEKYTQKQAVGALLAYLLKNDVSFFSGEKNRQKLSGYTRNDIGLLLIEFVIKKIGHDEEIVNLIGHPDIDAAHRYKDAQEIVTNLLIRFDKNSNKIIFGDILNIIRAILVHDTVLSYLVNQYVLDLFIKKKEINDSVMAFTIKYHNENGEEIISQLNGQKIINYIRNEYNSYL